MKAIELIKTLTQGKLNIELCGIAESADIIQTGWWGYFSAHHFSGILENGFFYFYTYEIEEYVFDVMPSPDIVMADTNNETAVLLWKLENC